MKKIKVFSLLIVLSTGVLAQNWGEYDPYLSNPSLGAHNEMLKIGSLYQTEMTAYDYNPKSWLFWATSPFNNQRVAWGLKLSSIEGGVLKNTSAEANFIYNIPLSKTRLSFSLGGSVNQLQLIRERVEVYDLNDPIIQGAESGNWFNANFGISFSKVNTYYFGLAAYNLLPSQTNWMVSSFENKSKITYNLSGMYTFDFLEGNLQWELTGLASTNHPENFYLLKYCISTRIMFFKKSFWIGTGYLNETTIKGNFGVNVQNVSFAYTGYYSLGTASNYGYSFTKHEVVVILKLPYSKASKNSGV